MTTHDSTTPEQSGNPLTDLNTIEAIIAAFAREDAFNESVIPSDHGEMTFQEVQWIMPVQFWTLAHEWRLADERLFGVDRAIASATIDFLESAQSVDELDRFERAVCRWIEVTSTCSLPEVLGAAYVHYRADMRRSDLLSGMPYAAYLQSAEWQEKRHAALDRADHRCQLCNRSTRLHVHHRTYERRGHELPGDLIVLCADCHKLFHDNRRVAR